MRRQLAHVVLLTLALVCVQPGIGHAAGGVGESDEDADETTSSDQADSDDATNADADSDAASNGADEGAEPAEGESSEDVDEQDFPDSPDARLDRAAEAYSNGKYQLLRPLLEPTLVPNSNFSNIDREVRARQLFGVGLFFEAQQTTKRAERRDLLDRTKQQFLAILRHDPDYKLDPLNYPASVVEVFETVREENAEELEEIRRQRDGENGETVTETFYVERETTQRWFAVNFAPFGMGQFQNGDTAAGTVFAVGQASMLVLNGIAYAGVQLADRDNNGLYRKTGPGGEFAVARSWRNVQWAALGTFSALYLWSVIDGIARYEPEKVRIRSLDEPPPELTQSPRAPRGPTVRVGIGSVLLRW